MKKVKDKIQNIHGAVVHHGELNRRIYLMKLNEADPEKIISELFSLAKEKGYSKIFVKVPESAGKHFLKAGYLKEAEVPGFYNGLETALFMGYYFSKERMIEKDKPLIENILKKAKAKKQEASYEEMNDDFLIRQCVEKDAEEMAFIYKQVFPSYPFPIDDPEYIKETMHSHVLYFAAEFQGEVVALSSAETDMKYKNAEMTDFATLPSWRGNGLASSLLLYMEQNVEDIKTAYTIARTVSPGMNITFAKTGYSYGGRLINNTNISGSIESMNIWYKHLDSDG